MARFIISRTAMDGLQFILRSDKERVLAVSKQYATLDACKKGICSLVCYAPVAPLADLTVGAHCQNPKFELFGSEAAYGYRLKAPNGKAVIEGGPFESKKACLRAVSMLRKGVCGAPVLMNEAAQLTTLTVGKLIRDAQADPEE